MEIFVSKEIQEYRGKICQSCDKLTFIHTCNICNCFMPAKTKLPAAFCPDNKWPAVDNQEQATNLSS